MFKSVCICITHSTISIGIYKHTICYWVLKSYELQSLINKATIFTQAEADSTRCLHWRTREWRTFYPLLCGPLPLIIHIIQFTGNGRCNAKPSTFRYHEGEEHCLFYWRLRMLRCLDSTTKVLFQLCVELLSLFWSCLSGCYYAISAYLVTTSSLSPRVK